MLKIIEKTAKITDTLSVKICIIPLENAALLLVTDDKFRLGNINVSSASQQWTGIRQTETIPIFSSGTNVDIINKIIGSILTRRLKCPIISIISLRNQDSSVIKAVTKILSDISLDSVPPSPQEK
ncbi:MAG: hypothetical protein ACTSW4_03595 [Candidatus Ranarchaeia archaeon]